MAAKKVQPAMQLDYFWGFSMVRRTFDILLKDLFFWFGIKYMVQERAYKLNRKHHVTVKPIPPIRSI